MTSAEVRAYVESQIGGDWSQTNAHGVDLRKCLVAPRKAACRNTFPRLNGGKPLNLWVVLEEIPGAKDGYLVVFDEKKRIFGLANWGGEAPVFIGFYGDFLTTLQGM